MAIRLLLALALTASVAQDFHPGSALNAQPTTPPRFRAWAATPPMGWNSWDSFGTAVTEAQTREQAALYEQIRTAREVQPAPGRRRMARRRHVAARHAREPADPLHTR